MTDLQMSLIGIGAAIVVGVIIYNKYQEHRARKDVERAFSDSPDDILMNSSSGSTEERKEPTSGGFSAADVQAEQKEHREPSLSDDDENTAESEEGELDENVPLRSSRESLIDDLIDYTIPLNLDEPVRGEKILPLLQALRYTGNKPVFYVGLTKEPDSQKEVWQAIVHGGVYYRLNVGVQLANRVGALNEIEYSELVTRLRQLSDSIGAEPEVPDMSDVIQVARSLYQFVAEHDAKLGVNIRTNGAPWAKETLFAVLEKQGFELRPDGVFIMRDAEGGVLFSLSVNEATTSENISLVTLLLDVPCVAQEKTPFNNMIQCAKALCVRLDGSLVDDSNQMLNDEVLGEIAEQVDGFYEEMKASSIPAGSTRAQRLFN